MTYRPFEPRCIVASGACTALAGFMLKRYAVHLVRRCFESARFEGTERYMTEVLAQALEHDGVPRVGFFIQHQGQVADYLVLAWWSQENELAFRIWVNDGLGWRPATTGESFCVWDLEVVWFERNLWIETGLADRDLASAVPDYLSRRFGKDCHQ